MDITYVFQNGQVADGSHVSTNFDDCKTAINALTTNATHTGDVTGNEALTIGAGKVVASMLNADLNTKALLSGHLHAITDAADVTVDWSHSATQTVVLDQTSHIIMTNPVDGQVYRLILTQEASGGGHTVTWHDTIRWAGGSAPTLTTTVNKSDIITFLYAGTTWYASITQNF